MAKHWWASQLRDPVNFQFISAWTSCYPEGPQFNPRPEIGNTHAYQTMLIWERIQ